MLFAVFVLDTLVVFLLLSGIGLYYSMKKCGNVITFYKHRIRRIIPSFLLIAGVLYGFMFLNQQLSFGQFLLHMSTLYWWMGEGALEWYVSFIMLCYLIYPLLYRVLNGRHGVKKIILIAGIILISEIYLFANFPAVFMRYDGGLTRIFIFLIGTVLGKREYEGKGYQLWNVFIYGVLFVLVRGALIVYADPQSDLYTVLHHLSYIPGALFIAEIFPLIRSVIPENPVRHAIEVLGSVSLEVYLVHDIYIEIFKALPIYQRHNSPMAYLLFVVLPSVLVVLLGRYVYLSYNKKKVT